jgi:hypothetical protein
MVPRIAFTLDKENYLHTALTYQGVVLNVAIFISTLNFHIAAMLILLMWEKKEHNVERRLQCHDVHDVSWFNYL